MEGRLDESAAPTAVEQFGLTAKEWKHKLTAKHIFTHVEWHMTGYTLEVDGDGAEDFLWADGEALSSHAVPSAFARYYREAEKELKNRS